MSIVDLVLGYLAVGLVIGALGAAVACDGQRSMQVRSCATWVALTFLAWPLTSLALVAIAVSEARHRRHVRREPVRSVVHTASGHQPY